MAGQGPTDVEALLGARLQPAWLAACVAHLDARGGFNGLPVERRARLVLQQLLPADLNTCGAASLPPGIQSLHDNTLRGKFLLQADEVLNIGAAVRDRYTGTDSNNRCLKLLLTDGAQQVAGLEYRPTPALHSAMPAGCKLVVRDAPVRRGMLLLTPENCSVLGGGVAALEAARQRMVAHWAQPAGPPAPLQEVNGEASARRSRLALPKPPGQQAAAQPPQQPQQQQQQRLAPLPALGAPPAADFSFAQAPQTQAGAPQRTQARVQPQLLQRLRQAAAGGSDLPAGTTDDPICLDDDTTASNREEQQQQRQGEGGGSAGLGAAVAADVEMVDAEQEGAAAGDEWGGDADWGDDPPAEPGVDPWERGYEEDEEQLPDADPPPDNGDSGGGWEDGGSWEEDGGDGEGGAAGDEQQGNTDEWAEEGEQPEGGEGGGGGGEDSGGGGGGSENEASHGVEQRQQQQQQQPPAAAAAPTQPGTSQPVRRRSGGRAAELLPPLSGQEQRAGPSGGAVLHKRKLSDGSQQQQQRQQQQQQQATPALAAPPDTTSTVSSSLPGVPPAPSKPAATAAAPPPSQQQPAKQQRQVQQESHATRLNTTPGVLADPGLDVELEPLDPSLLDVAPTLAEVLFRKAPPAEAAAPAAVPTHVQPAALVVAPAASAVRPAVQAAPATGLAAAHATLQAAAAEESDDDAPCFDGLLDISPPRAAAAGGGASGSGDEPFTYLLRLAAQASSGGGAGLPLCVRILGTVKTFVGKLRFKDPQSGEPQYGMDMLVEDGSLVVRATLSHGFMREFFDLEPQEFEACLTDPARRSQAARLAGALQRLLAGYSGLMEVRVNAPNSPLEILDLLGDLNGDQSAALQLRVTGAR
ncbi:recQ-mediated genome instability 1 [Micractinium conductrix]|uniref:RecQ-mediated genome instability protein 1 n=1 Tax=Micractinium conductrix TaxID=554055 RepID=A0A2P6VIC4_9CHLO|nr:recQ-mediated genome instability 1 [Micractinium conductrix]|eukprot:PSC73828.1 recQ-mediated genome instability 1 [Micractinium conductrix]